MHVERVVDGLVLLEVGQVKFAHRKDQTFSIVLHDLENGTVNLEHLDGGVRAGEVRSAAGREVGVIGLAPDGRQDDVQARELDGLHTFSEKQQVAPAAAHDHHFGVSKRRKLESGFAAQG